jgi:glutamate---cysteine ligase / carboxylate-amine ligase
MRHTRDERPGWDHEPVDLEEALEPTQIAPASAQRLASSYSHGFAEVPYPTVGLEEELILVEPGSLLAVNEVERALALVGGDARYTAELRACQLELRTPVCVTVADAHRELAGARARVVERLDGELRLLAVGTHPAATGTSVVTARKRYRRIASEWPWATRRGQPSGLHVHVGVSGADEALAVFNAARSYLPELAALAANSPFFEGAESGLASTRLKLTEDLPRAGIPPAFASWGRLAEFVTWGIGGGLFGDLGQLWWDLRLRPEFGTIEFRVTDVQTRPAEAAAVAAVCRALVVSLAERAQRGERLPVHETHVLHENRCRAMRDGLDATLVDPDSWLSESARMRIDRLLLELAPKAAELGDDDAFEDAWSLLRANGAMRQREVAADRGMPELLRWLADETEQSTAAVPVLASLEAEPAAATAPATCV